MEVDKTRVRSRQTTMGHVLCQESYFRQCQSLAGVGRGGWHSSFTFRNIALGMNGVALKGTRLKGTHYLGVPEVQTRNTEGNLGLCHSHAAPSMQKP